MGIAQRARRLIREGLFRAARRLAQTDDGRQLAADTLRGLLAGRPALDPASLEHRPPYPELGAAQLERRPSQRAAAIFITGRFRSGSTLLWNIFRNVSGITAFYEPLNERRWFDPKSRGDRVDPIHRGVRDYWREYAGLESLGNYYQASWTDRNIFMEADFWDPDLKRYVEIMIERAAGRPVLKFNRIDFRLPWFRQNFPSARIVHLYRHPRDQWCSSLLRDYRLSTDEGVRAFAAHDNFYLLAWARDLKYHFPFLAERNIIHPYQLFYYIWKLSYMFGAKYADYSLSYERLIESPDRELVALFDHLGIEQYDPDRLKALIAAPTLGRWSSYADDHWFKRWEESCENVLADFFASPTRPNPLVRGKDDPPS